jgi:hypothetical protein
MKKNTKNIIIAYFFVALIQLPSIWQLEHVFDNDHGIIYHSNSEQFQKINSNCSALHKQLNYVYWFNWQIFSFVKPKLYFEIEIKLPQIVSKKNIYDFSLRAPPLS